MTTQVTQWKPGSEWKPATHWDAQRYWQQTDHHGQPRILAIHMPDTHDGYKLFFNPAWQPRPKKEHDYYKYHPAMILSFIALFILIVMVSAALH